MALYDIKLNIHLYINLFLNVSCQWRRMTLDFFQTYLALRNFVQLFLTFAYFGKFRHRLLFLNRLTAGFTDHILLVFRYLLINKIYVNSITIFCFVFIFIVLQWSESEIGACYYGEILHLLKHLDCAALQCAVLNYTALRCNVLY